VGPRSGSPFSEILEDDDVVATPPYSVAVNVVQCTGAVVAGAFSCGDANNASGAGAISGRLYGPAGTEIAGVFTRYGLAGYDLTYGVLQSGIAGAFVAQSGSLRSSTMRTHRAKAASMPGKPGGVVRMN
jgi:hypothetical protein